MKSFALPVAVIFLTLAVPSHAKDALQILPTRIVFDGQSSADLTLMNRGDEAGNYRILLRNIRTDDYGQFAEALEAEEGELFADKLIRYSPRSITVAPDASQKVRLVVRKPAGMEPGEYRTHMVFQSLPKQVSDVLNQTDEVKVSVEPIVEISIPVIVRHGQLDATIKLVDLSLSNDNMLSLQIQREGSRSLYGDIEVFINSGKANGVQAGFVRGVSVYVPNPVRNFLLPLTLPDNYDARKDSLLVRFKEDSAYGGDQVVESYFSPR